MKRKFLLIMFALCSTFYIQPAAAQTVENAFTFFDQVMTNQATEVELQSRDKSPIRSSSSSCKTSMSVPSYEGYPPSVVIIDWTKTVDIGNPFPNDTKPALRIVGGVSATHYYGDGTIIPNETGPVATLRVMTGAASMDERLMKAVNVIIESCGDKSTGF